MLSFLSEHWNVILPLAIFLLTFTAIVFEIFDKTIVAMGGAMLLIIFRSISFEQAIEAVNFEIIALLSAMMIIVEIARESGFFTMTSFKLAKYSKGNPFLIFLLFTIITASASALLDNVTTILIVIPITIELVRGMGYNPFPFIIAEIMFSNIGGALTLVGDPPNVLVGTAVGLSFNSFIIHLFIPITAIIIFTLLAFYLIKWKELKPIHHNLPKLFLSNVLLKKIQYEYQKTNLDKKYMTTVVIVLGLTILGFLLQFLIGLPIAVIAATGALTLMLIVHKRIHVHHVFSSVEWGTLGFFAGLFVVVAGLEHAGILELVAKQITNLTNNFNILLLIILWSAGIFSMIIDNIPFVTVMIPILMTVETHYADNPHAILLWWALILGAALGGNGTMIGASANVIGVDIAKKHGIKITFLSYLKYSFPLTLIALGISSIYLLIWSNYF